MGVGAGEGRDALPATLAVIDDARAGEFERWKRPRRGNGRGEKHGRIGQQKPPAVRRERAVGGEDAGLLDKLAWTAETLTGRSLGTSAISAARELVAPKDDARAEERKSRQDVPILSAAWRPFWRKTGYGLVERAAAMREEQKRVNALVGSIAERYARGQPVSEEDARWFAQHAAQPGESVRQAAERVWKLRNMTPDQRAADSLSRRSRREIEEKYGYVPTAPPEPTER